MDFFRAFSLNSRARSPSEAGPDMARRLAYDHHQPFHVTEAKKLLSLQSVFPIAILLTKFVVLIGIFLGVDTDAGKLVSNIRRNIHNPAVCLVYVRPTRIFKVPQAKPLRSGKRPQLLCLKSCQSRSPDLLSQQSLTVDLLLRQRLF